MSHPTVSRLSRRALLSGGAALGLSAVGMSTLPAAASAPVSDGRHRLARNPFTLGVASGDPLPDSVVLWTRLAVEPLADDGRGGMPDRPLTVRWQLATDERFTTGVRTGTVTTTPEFAHSVHVEPGGLAPGTEYFYRFRVHNHISGVGRTRTAPAPGTMPDLTMCFASCSHFGHGRFTAYRRLAEDQPDLILHLGDYQYEYPAGANDVRAVVGPETRTLAQYRQRHAQYKTDRNLQLAHATAPWLVVWDDHETENNWAGDVPEQPDPGFARRRKAAFRAYYENMPLRATAAPNGTDMRLYRRLHWGDLATFHMLDTRQYRDDQACGDGLRVDCAARRDPDRSILGAAQQRWLLDGFDTSRARWDVLGQQVFFAQRDLTPGPRVGHHMDSWDGYQVVRNRVARAMGDSAVRNGVVLTGDVHRHWAAEITEKGGVPDSRGVGVELVTTSISSGGDGDDSTNDRVRAENPHVKFYANRRGYVRTRFSATELRADFRTLPYVRRAGAPARTAARFVVEDRDPRLHSA